MSEAETDSFSTSLASSGHSSLIDLFDLNPVGPVWTSGDLAGLIRHQLASPIEPALGPLHEQAAKLMAAAPEICTFADLLFAPRPPLGLLRLTKRFAKVRRHGGNEDSGIPPEIDKLLYAASVVAARLHLNEQISELPDDVFAGNARWAISQSWTPPKVSAMMQEWLTRFGAGERL